MSVCVCTYLEARGHLRCHSIDVIHLNFSLEMKRMCVFMFGVGLGAVHVSTNACGHQKRALGSPKMASEIVVDN